MRRHVTKCSGDFGRKTNDTKRVGQRETCIPRVRGEEQRNSRESTRFKGHLRVPALCLFNLLRRTPLQNTPARDEPTIHLRSNSLLAARNSFSYTRCRVMKQRRR